MPAIPLLVASLADVLMGGLFAYIGRAIAKRPVGPEARLAARAFSLWWFSIGFLVAADGLRGFAGSYDLLSRPSIASAFVVVFELWIVVLSAAMAGLLLYLAYLYQGSTRLAVPLAIFYGAWAAIAIWQTAIAGPTFVPGRFVTLVEYTTPLADWVELAFFLLLYVPQIVAIVLYLRLLPQVRSREARVRMLATGLGLALWIGSNLAAAILDAIDADAWQIAKRAIGLVVSLAILATYAPPAPLAREKGPSNGRPRDEALARRVRELV